MKKQISLVIVAVMLTVALILGSLALAQEGTDSLPEPDASPLEQGPTLSDDDSNPAGGPEVFIPEAYRARAGTAQSQDTDTLYFTPQDENTSTTILFLYNTSSVTATVGLQTYRLDGTRHISTSVSIAPAGLVRIAGDTVSSTSSTWQDVALINFTTFSTYARMTMPAGVKAEAYVVWNNSSTYDPLQVAPTLPIRFSTDPAAVFLPTVSQE